MTPHPPVGCLKRVGLVAVFLSQLALKASCGVPLVEHTDTANKIADGKVQSWVSADRYFTNIQLEVSKNYFLPTGSTNFSIQPAEMTLITGALLPRSFYIKYAAGTYGTAMIQGESDKDFWYLNIPNAESIAGSKEPSLGWTQTNWTSIASAKQEIHLRDFTQFGFLFLKAGSMHISGTNFEAVANFSGTPISGSFSSVDDSGVPHSFRYSFIESDGARIRFEGKFKEIDTLDGRFDCEVALWDDGKLVKVVRIKTVSDLRQATGTALNNIFEPKNFADIKTAIVESNGLRYLITRSGKLRLIAGLIPVEQAYNHKSAPRLAAWILIPNAILIFAIIVWFKNEKNKQHQNRQQDKP